MAPERQNHFSLFYFSLFLSVAGLLLFERHRTPLSPQLTN
jgi:hypothetical protein